MVQFFHCFIMKPLDQKKQIHYLKATFVLFEMKKKTEEDCQTIEKED